MLLVAVLDEYKYDKQDADVTLHLKCSDGTYPQRRDKMHVKLHTFGHFHIEPLYTPSDLTEGQCNKNPDCIRYVVRTGDILTNMDAVRRKFGLCYGKADVPAGGKHKLFHDLTTWSLRFKQSTFFFIKVIKMRLQHPIIQAPTIIERTSNGLF